MNAVDSRSIKCFSSRAIFLASMLTLCLTIVRLTIEKCVFSWVWVIVVFACASIPPPAKKNSTYHQRW
jgi:hypothetical protein